MNCLTISARTNLTRFPSLQTAMILLLSFLCSVGAASVTLAQESKPKTDRPEAPPELSLQTLYHPEDKYDFDGEVPETKWVEDDSATLLIRRDNTWNQVDLVTGMETQWPMAKELREKLAALDGIEESQLESMTNRAVQEIQSVGNPVLVRVGKGLAIVLPNEAARWLTRDASEWRDATLDPSSRRVGYTKDGDMFLLDVADGTQLRLSNDESDTLLDGLLDWTYQEEIFGRGKFRGFWFSPDGNWLAMLRIDISGIEPYTLSSSSSDRGKGLVSRYPKAGDPIPHATLLLWDLRPLESADVPLSRVIAQSTPQQERIITGVWWHPHQGSLLFSVSDRTQTWRELRRLDPEAMASGGETSRLLLREESPAWVEPPADPGWLSDGSLIWRSELPTGRTRLYHISHDGKRLTPLTPGDFDARDFSVSPEGDFLLVTGDAERGTIDQQVYRAEIPPQSSGPPLRRLTEKPGWHTANLSPDGRWFVDVHSSAAIPPSVSVRSIDGESQLELFQGRLRVPGELIEPEIFHIRADDGAQLPAMLIRPRSTSAPKVPVLIEVYGGPRAATVVNRWSGTRMLYRQLLARRGIATLMVDNRSSAGRGLADTWSIQGRVGELEFSDLMTAVDWLRQQNWVDKDRLAIRGWSFGGFLTLYAMTHSDAFAAGIAGGSVTDWREYDAFYTERYMGLPSENQKGYDATAPVRAAETLHGEVLLIHGESDDNVHPSGTMRMAKALQEAGKQFELMIYPDEAHAVHQPKRVWHLSQLIDRFLLDHLGLPPGDKR